MENRTRLMNLRLKAIIINTTMVVTLIAMWRLGYPLAIVVGTGIFLLLFVNVLMLMKAKTGNNTTARSRQ